MNIGNTGIITKSITSYFSFTIHPKEDPLRYSSRTRLIHVGGWLPKIILEQNKRVYQIGLSMFVVELEMYSNVPHFDSIVSQSRQDTIYI